MALTGRTTRAVVAVLQVCAAVLLFCLMGLTCIDVIGRYFFNSPLTGGFELTEAMLAVLIFSGLPLVTIRADHIEIDLFKVPEVAKRAQHVFVNGLGMIFTGFLSYRLWLRGIQLDAAGETTLQLGFKLAYIGYAMSFLMALTAIAFLLVALAPPTPRDHATADP